MAALFAQMWVLCLVAFLLGALVTWLAVGRTGQPRRASPPPVPPAPPLDPVQAAQARPTPLPGVPRHSRTSPLPRPAAATPSTPRNPALAELDNLRRPRPCAALGAVDRHPHRGGDSDPRIPRQQGPGPRGADLFTPPEQRRPPADDQDGSRERG